MNELVLLGLWLVVCVGGGGEEVRGGSDQRVSAPRGLVARKHKHTQKTHSPARLVRHVGLRQAKVGQHHVPLGVQEHVLRLQVAVHDPPAVQVGKRADDLGAVAARDGLAEHALAVQVEEQVAAVDKVEDQVELGGGLERVAQAHDVRVLDGRQHVALAPHVAAVVAREDAALAHDLHGVDAARGDVADLEDLAKGALPHDAEDLEVLGAEARRGGGGGGVGSGGAARVGGGGSCCRRRHCCCCCCCCCCCRAAAARLRAAATAAAATGGAAAGGRRERQRQAAGRAADGRRRRRCWGRGGGRARGRREDARGGGPRPLTRRRRLLRLLVRLLLLLLLLGHR